MSTLRWYQQEASDAAWEWVRRCIDPCVIEAATGAGKSHIIADIARRLYEHTGKRILVLAPSAELVIQNHEKYESTGNKASLFSASAGTVNMRHHVIFGTPGTVANSVRRFQGFACVIVDEAHRTTPTVKSIVESMRASNSKLRVIGLTATPYRLGEGYIFSRDMDGNGVDSRDPFYFQKIYEIGAHQLIAEGFLTPPATVDTTEKYDTSGLTLNRMGKYDAETVERAFEGHGRLTSAIVADVVERSRDRQGVMFFAATIAHGLEIMASLPPEMSFFIDGKTDKKVRAKAIAAFKAKRIKYLVNVAVLTTGFDAAHVDVIAILRATESVALLQQIIGRGLRLDKGKTDCLILDYAGNIDKHCPNGDVFSPVIESSKEPGEGEGISAICPDCSHENNFKARPNIDGYLIDKNGYFCDKEGVRIGDIEKPMPAHFGRRCEGFALVAGQHERCHYRWTMKVCEKCKHENDIAARYCEKCKAEIIDPNEKLQLVASPVKKDPYAVVVSECIGIKMARHVTEKGESLRVMYGLDDGDILSEWYFPGASNQWHYDRWRWFAFNAWSGTIPASLDDALASQSTAKHPRYISHKLKKGTRFREVVAIDWTGEKIERAS